MTERRHWWRWLIVVACAYVFIASAAHAIRNPELTETQRFLHLVDAMLWR